MYSLQVKYSISTDLFSNLNSQKGRQIVKRLDIDDDRDKTWSILQLFEQGGIEMKLDFYGIHNSSVVLKILLTKAPYSSKMESMQYILRLTENDIQNSLQRNKSVLLLGARQTGKTTLIQRLPADLSISFVRPDVRQQYEKNSTLLVGEVEALKSKTPAARPLVVLDEVQRVPEILDIVQDLIDRKIANFILTGSSARKLRHGSHINLLPGRVTALKLNPLNIQEIPQTDLKTHLLYGSLPAIHQVTSLKDKEIDLSSYVITYLEEEIRAEAIVRNLGPFARFLESAAIESGKVVNFRKLSQEIGVAHTTIASYYQILEDCLIVEKIMPLTKSETRKKLTKTHKYIFFDMGVRRLTAHQNTQLTKEMWGYLFEQFIGLQLIQLAELSDKNIQIKFWRDPDGPEVDFIVDNNHSYLPLEVKWTKSPTAKDVKHLKVFLNEYPNAKQAYLICQCERDVALEKNITAIPWQKIKNIF